MPVTRLDPRAALIIIDLQKALLGWPFPRPSIR